LHSRSSYGCYYYLYPNTGPPADYGAVLSREALDADLAAQTAVIRSSATSPAKPVSEAEVAASLEKVLTMLQAKYTPAELAMFADAPTPAVDKRKACLIAADLYREAMKLPPSENAKLIRYLLSP
jgi:hypothetical protein